jgi:hypothetical protein
MGSPPSSRRIWVQQAEQQRVERQKERDRQNSELLRRVQTYLRDEGRR